MKKITFKFLVFLVILSAEKVVAQQADKSLKEPDYIVNKIYYFDSEILKGNDSSGVIVGNALVEIKNNTKIDLPVPSLSVDALKVLLLKSNCIKPGASIFYNVKWDAATPESPPLLLYMAMSKEEVSRLMQKDSSHYYHPGFRTRGFDLQGFGDYEINEIYKTNNRYGARSFNCPECLKNYYLMPIDTLINKKDTSQLKEKYTLYKVIDNFYVLYNPAQQNALLAEFYTNTWKPRKISSKEIEVQKEKFMYTGTDKNKEVFAIIKITNHSKDYLYLKKKITVPDNSAYKLSFFGEDSDKNDLKINALAPGGTLIVKLVVEYDKLKKNAIDLGLNTLFINCPNTKHRINFSPDYLIEPKTE